MRKLLYPSLQQGLVGAWCPSIDRSRSTLLIDQSGYGNHGTLTNMDPATDWAASNGRTVLDFDGSNDHVPTTKALPAVNDASLLAWVVWRGTALGYTRIADADYSAGFWLGQNSSNSLSLGGGFKAPSSPYGSFVTIADNTRPQCVVVTRIGVLNQAYINGGIGGAAYTGSSGATTSTTLIFGTDNGLAVYGNFQLLEFSIYSRALTLSEISLLATRPGIAYETYRVPVVRGYSVGGGGTTHTGSTALVLGSLEFAGTGTTQAPTFAAAAALGLGSLGFAGTSSVINPAYEATSALVLGGLETSVSGSTLPPESTGATALVLGGLEFAGIVDVTNPNYTGESTLVLGGLEFAGSGNTSVNTFTANADLIFGGIEFTGLATSINPIYTGETDLTLPGFTFTGSATFVSGTFTGSSSLVLGGIDFSSSAEYTPPNFTGTASLIFGGLEFAGLQNIPPAYVIPIGPLIYGKIFEPVIATGKILESQIYKGIVIQ